MNTAAHLTTCLATLALLACGSGGGTRGDGTVQLFNGKNLDGFYTYLQGKGKNKDPNGVFWIRDGMIHVSGEEYGYLATEKEYANYHLVLEYKWGEKTWAPRKAKARDSGILFHFTGPDKIWPKSHEFQIMEGSTGDLILVDGATVDYDSAFEGRLRGGEKGRTSDGRTVTRGVFWPGRSPKWKDAAGFRGEKDLDKPLGDWNRLDLVCSRDSYTFFVNGREVIKTRGAQPAWGRILIQSEGAELFIRKIEMKPLE